MEDLQFTISLPENSKEEVDYLFREMPHVETSTQDIFSLNSDALLVPLNSFGFFDSGFPLLIADKFGFHIQDDLQKQIKENHFGELLVGDAEILPSGKESHAHLIVVPVERTPSGDISKTLNAYLAMRGALIAVKMNSDLSINSIVLPLIGTGSEGNLSAYASARQIRYAIRAVVREKPRRFENISKARRREISLKRAKRKGE